MHVNIYEWIHVSTFMPNMYEYIYVYNVFKKIGSCKLGICNSQRSLHELGLNWQPIGGVESTVPAEPSGSHLCMYVCLWTFVCVYTCVRIYVCMYVRIYTNMCPDECKHACACNCMQMCMNKRTRNIASCNKRHHTKKEGKRDVLLLKNYTKLLPIVTSMDDESRGAHTTNLLLLACT